MQDLSGKYGRRLNLVPSSMNGGNTTYDDPGLAMTAPGSQSVNPAPEKADVLPLPRPSGPEIPVSDGPGKPRVAGGQQWQNQWTDASKQAGGFWKGTEGNG